MVRINLLPVRVSKKKQAGKQQLWLFALAVVAALAVNWYWAGLRRSELEALDAKIARTKADLAQLDRIIGEVKDIKEAKRGLQEKLDVLDKLKAGRSGPVRMLDELARIVPKRVWLRRFDEKGGNVVFEGYAMTIDDVSAFMTELKKARYFGDVELKKTVAKEDKAVKAVKLVDFVITAAVRYDVPLAVAGAPAPGARPAGK